MGRNLFQDNSENEDEKLELKTNKEYAKCYNEFRRKELVKKWKDRKQNSDSESDSDTESDYSESEMIKNPEFDEEFAKVLCSLKTKDPKIYDDKLEFFSNVEVSTVPSNAKKTQQVTLKDYERNVLVEGHDFENEDSNENQRPQSPSYVEEQRKLKAEIRKAVEDSDVSSDEEFGGIFKKRQKIKNRKDEEDQESGEVKAESKEVLKPLKNYWSKPDLPRDEQFLRDYILNNGYIENDDAVPNYDEIVGNENLSEDEEELEKQAEFEHKFNFRYEEPDKEFIKRYPRTIENTVRLKDDKRKQKREEIKERKKKEKEEKFKEIEMLKAIKRKEIEEKIQKLKEVVGNDELPFQNDDIEEDFDPEAHDKRMREIFNDEYYDVDEGDDKPECPDIEELKVEDWDNYDPNNDADDEVYNYEPHCEDEDFNMDCDYDPNQKADLQNELIENTKSRKDRRKRRNRFMEMIKAEKPTFNPDDERTYAEYIDEYYKMDCEDIIDDIPCRFKYVETVPNDFGLTIEEILLAKTKELNQWASLKKAVQIRPDYEEKKDQRLFKMKAKNEALKRKIFVSIYGPQSEDVDEEIQDSKPLKQDVPTENAAQKKKKKKKNKKTTKAGVSETTPNTEKGVKNEDSKKDSTTTEKSKPETSVKVEAENLDIDSKQIHPNGKAKQDGKEQHQGQKKEPKPSSVSNKFKKPEASISNGIKVKKQNPFKAKKPSSSQVMGIDKQRLKAYGISPRNFVRQQKYVNGLKKHQKTSQKNS